MLYDDMDFNDIRLAALTGNIELFNECIEREVTQLLREIESVRKQRRIELTHELESLKNEERDVMACTAFERTKLEDLEHKYHRVKADMDFQKQVWISYDKKVVEIRNRMSKVQQELTEIV